MIASHAPLKIFKLSRPLKRPRRDGRRRSLSVLVMTMYLLTQAFTNTMVSMINNKIMDKHPRTTLNSPKRLEPKSRPRATKVYSAKLVNARDRE